MSEQHRNDRLPEAADHDLRALAEYSALARPTLDESITRLRRAPSAAPRWKELWMPIVHSFARRPWFATAGLAALIVVASLVVPMSWQHTVGHDVALSLRAMQDPAQARDIAQQMKAALAVDHVSARFEQAPQGANVTLSAFVPAGGIDPLTRIQALAHALAARGFDAHATTTPRVERVNGSVYAYARDLVVRVETSGKTAPQIEAEIRQRLAEAGIQNTTVSVKDEGQRRQVRVQAVKQTSNGAAPDNLTLQLTKDGKVMGATSGCSLEERRISSTAGTDLELTFTQNGRATQVKVAHVNTLSDAALKAEIEGQLRRAGVTTKVTVQNGEVRVEGQ